MCLLDRDYDGDYDLELSAWGEGVLREEGLLDVQKPDRILGEFRRRRRRFPRDISLLLEDSIAAGQKAGFTGIDPAFLEKLETLKELILPDSVAELTLTPAIRKIFETNNTLIRGSFDSFAERFAKEHGLRFRPADFVFAESYFEPAQESTRMTLVFNRNGSVLIREACSSPGSSPSHTLGGTFTHPQPKDFAKTKTAGQIAGQFSARVRDAILEDGRLAAFLDKARTHEYYMGEN